MTPILAAGFNDVAKTFGITYSRVALTTGLYMVGLGVGSLVFSPTAILFGKRPVYLGSAIMFILTSIWCAKAPNFANLATARVFQGISVSPVECLPSATIAEIFFLHERAFRVGIYTLLLLGGKNLIPLISAAIIQAKEWRWVFYIVAIVAGFGLVVLFLFVPETFWDRTPRPKSRRPSTRTRLSSHPLHPSKSNPFMKEARETNVIEEVMTPHPKRLHREQAHVDFIESVTEPEHEVKLEVGYGHVPEDEKQAEPHTDGSADKKRKFLLASLPPHPTSIPMHSIDGVVDGSVYAEMPHLHTLNSPYYVSLEKNTDCLNAPPASVHPTPPPNSVATSQDGAISHPISTIVSADSAATTHTLMPVTSPTPTPKSSLCYTAHLRHAPRKTYIQTLHPWNGGLIKANWFLIALRPFVLYTYPSVLWSALVYSLSVGWLIVLSESVASIYRNRASYNFSALGAGLVYLSPFIGGILGTVVAGKVSDITVRFMARKNGGVYEPEFRLVMAIPIAISTGIGLIGFGWSAQERDAWIVPTVFFGVISFGCSLGSTTAITFCVDSYRQYAGEALVTLNFSKNIFHGLMFSLFFPGWLEKDGPREVFVVIGAIQIACLISAVPMYIHLREAGKDGERAEELDGEV
jgi:MFS family permease